MARTLNRVQLIGHLGRDPEMKYTASGTAITTLSLATNRTRNGADGQAVEEAEWHRVVAWEKLAETCNQYLRKGSKIYIEGRLQSRKWKDQQGVERTTVEIVVSEMIMLDPASGNGKQAGTPAAETEDYSDEDMPF